jgi:hypothetical protein
MQILRNRFFNYKYMSTHKDIFQIMKDGEEVRQDVPSNTIVAGVPAKYVKDIA